MMAEGIIGSVALSQEVESAVVAVQESSIFPRQKWSLAAEIVTN